MQTRVEIKVAGQVQGVFFRQSAKEKADELNITGLVRNELDGSVLIVAEGDEGSLQKLVEWAKIGTEWARVEKVAVEWKGATGEFNGFSIK